MKVYLGADHRGYKLKEEVKRWLVEWGYDFEDLGNTQMDKDDDYSDWGSKVGEAVGLDSDSRGVVICGSGVGMNLIVNRFRGVRGMMGFDSKQVVRGVVEDWVNVLAIAGDSTRNSKAKKMVKAFLESEFSQEPRRVRRINKINKIETNNFKN